MRLWQMAFGVLAVGIAVLAGCTKKDEGSYRISGVAKFNGQSIPYGDVTFTPDGAKNNHGPQGFALIRDGKFDTSGPEGKGYAGGPTIIYVTGLARPDGGLICEYEYSVDLPKGNASHNIEVPESAGAGKGKEGI